MDDNCGEWVECMGVVSRRRVWVVGVSGIYGCGCNSYCSKWRFRANVIKSAVMVFSKDAVMVVGSEASIVFQKFLLIVI